MSQSQIELDKYARLKVLVLDDDRVSAHNLGIQLRFVGEDPVPVTSESWLQALRAHADQADGSRILGFILGDIRRIPMADLLINIHRHCPQLPLIPLHALAEPELAMLPETLRGKLLPLGDVINYQNLLGVLKRAREMLGSAPQALVPSRLISETGTAMFRSLSGQSASLRKIRELLPAVAKRPVTVLVTGESGTGKEIVARNLHYHSGRHGRPFIAVNCATISAERHGAELFGQEKGYNALRDQHTGLIERADTGTLFLDDVGELPLNIQAQLLRFLEDKTFQRVGGHDTLMADVRVVVATRQNLEQRIQAGKFREDLYYRISVMPIALPPLRQRQEDIPDLIRELISSLENRDEISLRFNSSAIESLQKHPWPGNVRELANLVERLGILQPNVVIGVSDLPAEYQYPVEETAAADMTQASAPPATGPNAPQAQGEQVPGMSAQSVERVTAATVAEKQSGAGIRSVIVDTMVPLNEARLEQYLATFERQLLEVGLEDSAGLVSYATARLKLDSESLRARMQRHGISESMLR